jgi:hypothetical protein
MRSVFVTTLLATMCLSIAVIAQQAQDLYQQGLSEENAAGNLERAVVLYRRSAAAADADRALAARALMRAAGGYEKLGRPAAATNVYAEVIRLYPDQRTEAGLARERLTLLRGKAPRDAVQQPGRGRDVSSIAAPVFERYCGRCHSETTRSGGLDLATLDQHDVATNTSAWEKVLRRLIARREPPAGSARPTEATYRTLIGRLQSALDAAYPATRPLSDAERVDDGDLAVRLARFIWNAAPDAPLLADATSGRLHELPVLRRQVGRMLRDARSSSLVAGFFTEWLSLDRVRKASPDPARFPGVDAELLEAMATETRLFLDDQLRGDHDAVEIWTADYTYVNARLARHYGLGGITGDEFRRVVWPDNRRAGLLGQAGILTGWSMSSRTSPTQRGRFVLLHFFGVDAPGPPANVPAMAETPPSGPTMRDRLHAHKITPSCAACHSIIDPIGLALENFDAVGAWRTMDGGAPIDASGAFVDGRRFDGPTGLRAGLLNYRDAYYANVVQQLLAYALGRKSKSGQVYDYEMPTVRAIVRASAADGYRWSSLLTNIADSTLFQMKHIVP